MRAEQLLAAVLANPGDDELRRVYGDLLVEDGHPHGELIALQFARLDGRATPEAAAREALLLERHGADILGPLITVVDRYTIERGFLEVATVPSHRAAYNVQRVVGHPLWSTVEDFTGPPAIYLDPAMRSMHALTADYGDVAGVVELCRSGPRPVRRLVIRSYQIPDAIYDPVGLPDLAELSLDIRRVDGLAPLAATPLAARLPRLVIGGMDDRIDRWHAAIVRTRPAPSVVLRAVRIGPWYCRAELDRGYRRLRMSCQHGGAAPLDLDSLLGHIDELDVTLDWRSGYAVPPLATQALAEVVARFPVSTFHAG